MYFRPLLQRRHDPRRRSRTLAVCRRDHAADKGTIDRTGVAGAADAGEHQSESDCREVPDVRAQITDRSTRSG